MCIQRNRGKDMTNPEPDNLRRNKGAYTGQADEIDAQRLCDAASSVFYAIVRLQMRYTGQRHELPLLLCPKSVPPCPCRFSAAELRAAEAFLLRLGMIERRPQDRLPLANM